MDGLWGRRANTNKLSLATSTNGGTPNDHPARLPFSLARRTTDISSHSNKNPFGGAMSPSTTSVASPTAGATNAFSLGSGAFASFGSAKTPKTPGGGLDYSSVMGGGKTPTAEKNVKDITSKLSKSSLTEHKPSSQPTAHTLRYPWVFWFRPPVQKGNGAYVDYEKTLHQTGGFDNVEDFWKIYARLARPSSLPLVSDYHIFKKNVRPIWEDEENKKGGKWIVRLKKGVADRYWEDLVLAIVGDQFADASEELCGAVLSVRNGEDILSIWTSNDGGKVIKIRETLKRKLNFPPDTKVEWKSHDHSMAQRLQIDEQRKEKGHRNGNNKENDQVSTPTTEKKQNL